MIEKYLLIKQSPHMNGMIELTGAKNAVLVIIASLILTKGRSTLLNVPNSADIRCILKLMTDLGAKTHFDVKNKTLTVDTTDLDRYEVSPEIMNKMRASILVMGPLLARFGKARIALPGGCLIGARPIDYHLQGFKRIGIELEENKPYLNASVVSQEFRNERLVLEYPSVGATENLMLYAAARRGQTVIVNAALEPEVLDLIDILTKMGADITVLPGATLRINGVVDLQPVTHSIIPDRLEAGALMLAACITKGSINLPNARADHMDIVIEKLRDMGHEIIVGSNPTPELPLQGIILNATSRPLAVSIKTAPYPGFPTDLQAPMTAVLTLCAGVSTVEETVFENRLMHIKELQKMGAQITQEHQKATIRGVEKLYGAELIASDIRASCALVLAGLAADGESKVIGIHHWERGYDKLEEKFRFMGGDVEVIYPQQPSAVEQTPSARVA